MKNTSNNRRNDLVILMTIVVLNFVFYMFALTRYDLSYGIDGPYYNIQIRFLINGSGLQATDLPLAYYLLTPFGEGFGQFLGLKIGMAFFGSLFPIPVYLTVKRVSRVHPVLLASVAAILVSFNWFNLRMVEDFMQNFLGVFWLLWVIYLLPQWLAVPQDLKLGLSTLMCIILALLTHLYVAGMTCVLALGLVGIFFAHRLKNGDFQFKLRYGIIALLVLAISFLTILLFPNLFSPFSKIISFVKDLGSEPGGPFFIVFFSLPYLIGVWQLIVSLVDAWKSDSLVELDYYRVEFIILVIVLFAFSMPLIPAEWGSRLILLAYLPITFMSVLFLEFLVGFLERRQWDEKQYTRVLFAVAAVFMISSIISAATFIPYMGPSITDGQYEELLNIRDQDIVGSGTILTLSFELSYWYQYVFNTDVIQQLNLSSVDLTGSGPYFQFITISNPQTPFNPENPVGFNILLPYKLLSGSGGSQGPEGGMQDSPPGGPSPSQSSIVRLQGTTVFHGTYFEVIRVNTG